MNIILTLTSFYPNPAYYHDNPVYDQTPVTDHDPVPDSVLTLTLCSVKQREAGSGGLGGRPTLLPSGPLTPEQLAERRKLSVRKGRLSVKRQKCSSMRKDRQPGQEKVAGGRRKGVAQIQESSDEDNDKSGSASDEDGEESGKDSDESTKSEPVYVTESEVMSEPAQEGSSETEGKHGSMGDSTWFRYSAALRSVFSQLNLTEQVDVMLKLLCDISMFDSTKLAFTVEPGSAKRLLEQRLSFLSNFQLRRRVEEVRHILLSSSEPEMLLASFLQDLLALPPQLAMLEQGGLKVEERMMGREQLAVAVAGRLALEFVSQRRVGPQLGHVALLHAIATVKEVGLSATVHGDSAILARAIR